MDEAYGNTRPKSKGAKCRLEDEDDDDEEVLCCQIGDDLEPLKKGKEPPCICIQSCRKERTLENFWTKSWQW